MYKHARTPGWAANIVKRRKKSSLDVPIGHAQRQHETAHAAKIRAANARRSAKKSHPNKQSWAYNPETAARINQGDAVLWPVYVTSGRNPNGTLKIHVLKSREHADSLGFTWAGRPSKGGQSG